MYSLLLCSLFFCTYELASSVFQSINIFADTLSIELAEPADHGVTCA